MHYFKHVGERGAALVAFNELSALCNSNNSITEQCEVSNKQSMHYSCYFGTALILTAAAVIGTVIAKRK